MRFTRDSTPTEPPPITAPPIGTTAANTNSASNIPPTVSSKRCNSTGACALSPPSSASTGSICRMGSANFTGMFMKLSPVL